MRRKGRKPNETVARNYDEGRSKNLVILGDANFRKAVFANNDLRRKQAKCGF